MQYVLNTKELTWLANHVASETNAMHHNKKRTLTIEEREEVVKAVLAERGFQWCDDE